MFFYDCMKMYSNSYEFQRMHASFITPSRILFGFRTNRIYCIPIGLLGIYNNYSIVFVRVFTQTSGPGSCSQISILPDCSTIWFCVQRYSTCQLPGQLQSDLNNAGLYHDLDLCVKKTMARPGAMRFIAILS